MLQVNGGLIAQGTGVDLITFTSNQVSPAPGDWGYILITDTSTDATYDVNGNYTGGSILENCVVEYAGSAGNGAVYLDAAHPLISQCAIRDNAASGIYAVNLVDTLKITNNTIGDNTNTTSGHGGGIHTDSGTVEISDNTITGNTATSTSSAARGGGVYTSYGTVTIFGNTVRGNTVISAVSYAGGGGIFACGGMKTISGNTINGNTAISDSSYAWSGGVYACNGPSSITGNMISGNTARGYTDASKGGVGTDSGTVTSNTIINNAAIGTNGSAVGGGVGTYGGAVTGNMIGGNTASGGLDVWGGGVFTEFGTVEGNTITGNTAISSTDFALGGGVSTWDGIVAANVISGNTASGVLGAAGGGVFTGSGTVTGNAIVRNSASAMLVYGVFGAGLLWDSGTGGITANTIMGNASATAGAAAVYLFGLPVFGANNLAGNATDYALENGNPYTSPNLDATGNWWGTTTEAAIQALIHDGYDDGTVGFVDFIPWLESPDTTAPISPPAGLTITAMDAGSISIQWSSNQESDLAGYLVYWGPDDPPFFSEVVDVFTATSYTITGLALDTYHIGVTAYDTDYALTTDDADTPVDERMTSGHESAWALVTVEPSIDADPPSYDYGWVVNAQPVAHTFTISNIGRPNLTLGTLALSGTHAADFGLQNDACSAAVLAPSGSCTVDVVVTASADGTRTAALDVPSDDPDTPTLSIALSAQGGAEPDIAISPIAVDYGTVLVGSDSTGPDLAVASNGTAELTISGITITGTDADQFSETDDCSVVSVGASCTITVTFAPTTQGAKSAILSIASDDPDTPSASIGLSGKGWGPVTITGLSATPSAGVVPLDVTFGVTPSGGSGTYTYSWDFENDGTADSTVQNPAHAYSAAGSYTATVTVTDAGDAGNFTTGQLTVNVVAEPPVFSPVGITGLSASPSTGVVSLDVAFGVTPSGGSGTYTYSWDFENDGTADSTARNPTHTYATASSYTATVTVTDAGDAGNLTTGQLTVNVLEAPVTLSVSVTATPTTGEAPLAVTFTAAISGGTTPYSVTWHFGDGTEQTDSVSSATATATHTYTDAGAYQAWVEVTSQNGAGTQVQTLTASIGLSVGEPSVLGLTFPTDTPTGASPTSGAAGTTFTFSVLYTSSANAEPALAQLQIDLDGDGAFAAASVGGFPSWPGGSALPVPLSAAGAGLLLMSLSWLRRRRPAYGPAVALLAVGLVMAGLASCANDGGGGVGDVATCEGATAETVNLIEADPDDTDFTDGKLYVASLVICGEPRQVAYRFVFSDGTETATGSGAAPQALAITE